jgi:hypothetical protein
VRLGEKQILATMHHRIKECRQSSPKQPGLTIHRTSSCLLHLLSEPGASPLNSVRGQDCMNHQRAGRAFRCFSPGDLVWCGPADRAKRNRGLTICLANCSPHCWCEQVCWGVCRKLPIIIAFNRPGVCG